MTRWLKTKRAAGVAVAAGLLLSSGMSPLALGLPGGISPEDVKAAIAAPISVPAGETTTVSLPVAAEASYSGGGWEVHASGGSATVVAPPSGGSISVPVSAAGYSATIVLVAVPANTDGSPGGGANSSGGAQGGAGSGNAGSGNAGSDNVQPGAGADSDKSAGHSAGNTGGRTDKSGGSKGKSQQQPQPTAEVPGDKPERQKAAEVTDTGAEKIFIESSISGNVIKAQLGIDQALSLYKDFKDVDESQVTLRYLDGEGNIIQGVKRDIDAAKRTLTLTYPPGQAPDNPFIMQLIRKDASGVVATAVLRDPQFKSADKRSEEEIQEEITQIEQASGFPIAWLAGLLAVGALLIVIISAVIVARRRKTRKS